MLLLYTGPKKKKGQLGNQVVVVVGVDEDLLIRRRFMTSGCFSVCRGYWWPWCAYWSELAQSFSLSTYEEGSESAGKFLEGIFSKSWCLAVRQRLVEKWRFQANEIGRKYAHEFPCGRIGWGSTYLKTKTKTHLHSMCTRRSKGEMP